MKNILGRIVLLVDDYDASAAFYEQHFGFKRLFDADAGNGRPLPRKDTAFSTASTTTATKLWWRN